MDWIEFTLYSAWIDIGDTQRCVYSIHTNTKKLRVCVLWCGERMDKSESVFVRASILCGFTLSPSLLHKRYNRIDEVITIVPKAY